MLACALTWAGPSHAQPSTQSANADAETRALARDLAQQGAQAFESGEYATALDRFTRAHTLFPAPSLSVMRARALLKLGRLVESLDAYEETQRTPLPEDAPEAYLRAVADAKQEAAELAPRIPRLLVRVHAPEAHAGALHVTLDGKVLPPALLDVERPIDPGRHELHASGENLEPVTKTVNLREGEKLVIDLTLQARARPGRVTRAALPEDGAAPTRQTWGLVAVGVGAAGLATSVVTGIIALKKHSSLESVCRPGCPPEYADDIDAFRVHRTLSYASLAVGAASAGVGCYLLFGGSSERATTALHVSPSGVTIRKRF